MSMPESTGAVFWNNDPENNLNIPGSEVLGYISDNFTKVTLN